MKYDRMVQLKRRLGELDAGKFLDVAVGRGEFLKFAVESFRSWIGAAGIDTNTESLEIARELFNALPVMLVSGSALSMPFPDYQFDTLTLSNAIHHIQDHNSLFKEMERVCKPGGLIIINEMINDNITLMQETHMRYHRLLAEIDNTLGYYHRETFSEKELNALIRQSRFQLSESFVHEEEIAETMQKEEIEQLVSSLHKRVTMLRNSEYYYFYENKARDIIKMLYKKGFHKPKHITFILRTLVPGRE